MILAFVVLACPCLLPPDLEERRAREDKFSAAAATSADWLRGQAVAEARRLGTSHRWAGEYDYYAGEGSGPAALTLAPNAGFAFESHACGEIDDRNVGAVTEEGDRVRLHPAYIESQPRETEMPVEYVAIASGSRRYLVPPDALQEFCNAVNRGDQPYFLQRRGGGQTAGIPATADGPLDCVLARPLWTRITSVGPPRVENGGQRYDTVATTVTLGAGRRDGVREGSVFLIQATGIFDEEELVVTKVGERSSQAELSIWAEAGTRRTPGVGWPVTTRRRATER